MRGVGSAWDIAPTSGVASGLRHLLGRFIFGSSYPVEGEAAQCARSEGTGFVEKSDGENAEVGLPSEPRGLAS